MRACRHVLARGDASLQADWGLCCPLPVPRACTVHWLRPWGARHREHVVNKATCGGLERGGPDPDSPDGAVGRSRGGVWPRTVQGGGTCAMLAQVNVMRVL